MFRLLHLPSADSAYQPVEDKDQHKTDMGFLTKREVYWNRDEKPKKKTIPRFV